VDDAVTTGVLGFLGGGALGSATENPWIALVAAAAGAAAGAFAGARMPTLKAVYQVQWGPYGWALREVQLPSGGAQPAIG
jgi:hypothetical protein